MAQNSLTEPQVMRPGSEDYKKIPSLYNGERVPYRIPANVCENRKVAPVGHEK